MQQLPKGFVYLSDFDSSILHDIKYATTDNFIGEVVRGYKADVVICTEAAAIALVKAQADAKALGYTLKIFDAYRPTRAIDHFMEWANNPSDTRTKEHFYPSFANKIDLFDGFIAKHSQHSRGSAVDLTLVTIADGKDVDMGSQFDFLGEESHTAYNGVSDNAQSNRALLKGLMESHGFKNYHREWWHYSLVDEPFTRTPEDHMDFEVF